MRPWTLLGGVSAWGLSMFEEKRDGARRLSMLRMSVAAFTIAEVFRLLARQPIGFPDALLAFCILFAIPISKKLDAASPDRLVEALFGAWARGGGTGGGFWSSASSAGFTPTAPESTPTVLAVDDLLPPVGQGRPVDDEP